MIKTLIIIYLDMCRRLNLDSDCSIFCDFILKSWQITEVNWMLNQKKKLLHEKILDDECELEKIIQILKLVIKIMKKSIMSHRSTLILVSLRIVDIWLCEIHQHYNNEFQIILYYEIIESENNTDFIWKKYMINLKNINKKLSELDLNDFKIKITIIFSSYSIWHKQIYYWKEEKISLADRQEKSKHVSQTEDDSDDESESD